PASTTDPTTSADQTTQSAQVVQASAGALQQDVTNFSFVGAGELDTLAQANTGDATAIASADFSAGQAAVQSQSGSVADVQQLATVSQTLVSDQVAQSSANTVQTATRNANRIWSETPSTAQMGAIDQSNTATATAVARDRAFARQVAAQTQAG